MRIIDVSIPISNDMVYFPGDPKPQISRVYSMENKDPANVSKIILSSHTGTHIDAPAHFIKNGNTIDKIPLERLIGKVRVLDVGKEDSITKKFLESKDIQYNERIFFKTKNSWYLKRYTKFFKNFVYLSVDAAEYLVEKKVEVVGIDYLSIEEFNSNNFPVHRLLLSNDVVIVEGLCLLDVNEGRYKYVALPLKIEECDGAPARVIIIED